MSWSHLRTHRGAYAALFALAVVFVLLVPIAPAPGSLLQRALWNAAHAPLFAVACCVALWLYGESGTRSRLAIIATLCAIAILTEGLQHFTGRSPSSRDLANNLAGIVVGYGAWLLLRHPRDALSARRRALLLAFIVAATGLTLAPVARSTLTVLAQQQAFPVLFDPHFSGALDMIRPLDEDDGTEVKIEGGGLTVRLPAGRRPGIEIAWFTRDWRGLREFVIDLENSADTELDLALRVADRTSVVAFRERFRARLTVPPHTRRSFRYELADIESAPGTRSANLDDMATITIFRRDGQGAEFVVHSIRLE